MNKLRNAHRAEIAKVMDAALAQLRYGEVSSYDPNTYSAKVTIQPEGTLTGWLPILSGWTGNSFGAYFGPQPGDQVMVAHVEANPEAGVIIGRKNTNQEKPPAVPAGEAWLVHTSGSYLKFTNDGKVSVHGTVLIQVGNLTQTLRKFVIDTFMALFNGHTHPGVQAGGSSTGAPTQQMDASHLSSILKGN